MHTVNVATLKAKLSEYLRRAGAGETFQILDRRRPVATLAGIDRSRSLDAAKALVRDGLAEWHGGKPTVVPVRPRKGPARVGDAVIEDRG